MELLKAARTRDLRGIEKELSHNADVNMIDETGYTALMWAVKNRQTEAVTLLFDKSDANATLGVFDQDMFDLAGCDKEILAILQNHLQEHIEHLMNSIPELCGSMMELRQMSEHLLIRLQAARIQLQQTKDTTQASSMGFYSIIKTFHSLLLQHSKKLALERLVSARIVADGVRQLHSNLDALLDQHGLELHSPLQHRDWQGQWDKDEGDAYKHIVAILEKDVEGVPRELNSTTRQENVLKLLRYESEEHGNYYDTTMMNIFKSAQLKLVRFSGLAVPEVPNWFLPEYEVQRHPTPFAHGSFGNVFKGTWLGSQVVVKCVDPKTEEDKRTFRREARIWQRARHRHVITFFGACDQGSPWFFVCEEAANGNLKNYLYHQKNKGRSLAWRKLYEAALGLHFLHQRQIIHCDLKCNQILVSAEGVAMLTDFGLSFMSVDSRPLTPPGGAVRWKAPECLNNSNHVPTKESDVYSFGMCVVEAVTGEYPWGNCPDPAVVFQMKRGLVFPRPKAFVDNEQWQFVQALCAPDPSKRLKMPDAIHLLKKFADQEQMQEWSSKAEDHEFD